jgi:hypothetical protein
MRIPGAMWAIALPTSEFAYVIPGDCIMTHQGRVERPGFDVGYLDITNAPVFRIAGQAQVEPNDSRRGTWEWTAGGGWQHISQESPGTYPVMYDSTGTLHIATSEHNGSQGWRYESETGELVTGDHSLNDRRSLGLALGIKDLWEFSHFGGVTIGQGDPPKGCHVLIDGSRRMLEPGDTSFIRVRYIHGLWAIAMTKLGVEAVIRWMTRAELMMLDVINATTPQPPTEPDKPEPPMPDHAFPHSALLQRFAAKFPLPQGQPGDAHENRCRDWCRQFAEQVRFTTGDEDWGVKRAAGPQSKDTIAENRGNGKMIVFDLMTGAGTGHPTLNVHPHGEEVGDGQTFIPVAPVDHLGSGPVPPPSPSTHAYEGGDNDTGQCDVILADGSTCNQPPSASVHQVSPTPEPQPQPLPEGVPAWARQLVADVAAIRRHFA